MAACRSLGLRFAATLLSTILVWSSAEATTPYPVPPLPKPKPADALTVKRTAAFGAPERPSDESELLCLAQAIYFEARGEPELGQRAVGQVILNRVASPRYPDTICGVVHQNAHLRNRCQFSYVCDGQPEVITETARWREILSLARGLFACRDPLTAKNVLWTSTHYHADYVSPTWAKALRPTGRVGSHLFYFERVA